MSAIIRPVPSRKALAFSFLCGLLLLLAPACGPAASPVTPEHRESTSTPVSDGAALLPGEATTPTPPPTSTAAPTAAPAAVPERIGDAQATANDSKDAGESNPQSGGTGGDAEPVSIQQSSETGEGNQAPPIPDKGELRYPNLGSRLDGLVASVEAGEATAEQAVGRAALHSGDSVAVTLYLSGGVEEVVAFLEENGGDPRNVGEDYVEAYVPVLLLGPVSERPGVIRVREIIPPEPGRSGGATLGQNTP